MAKNMTLSIDDILAKKMDDMPEVNWSQVARDAISRYIQSRESPELAPVIEKLTKEKNQQYDNGAKEAIRIAKVNGLEIIVQTFYNYDSSVQQNPIHGANDERRSNTMYTTFSNANLAVRVPRTKEFKRGFFETMKKLREVTGIE